jgi:hypothetical protein
VALAAQPLGVDFGIQEFPFIFSFLGIECDKRAA